MKKIINFFLFPAIVLFLILNNYGCNKDDNSVLSPARTIEGTWKTTVAVKHYIKTDFCTGNLEHVATQDRMVTMIITKGTDENHVNVEMRYAGSNFTVVNSNCTYSTGYVPDVSPDYLQGVISSTSLKLVDSQNKEHGSFSFTTDNMMGTWNDDWCMVYCQTVYTNTNELKLYLQH